MGGWKENETNSANSHGCPHMGKAEDLGLEEEAGLVYEGNDIMGLSSDTDFMLTTTSCWGLCMCR